MRHKKTIALYLRVSHSEQENNSDSILNQKRLLYQYMDSGKEWEGIDVIEKIDDGYTGLNFNRPAFLDLLSLANQQAVQCIIVKDLSRLGRNYIEVSDFVRHLVSKDHVRLISVNDRYDSDRSSGLMSDPQEGIVNLMYELYSRDLSDKVRTVIRKKQEMGEYKVPHPFYGYQFDGFGQLIKNDETAQVVLNIFSMYTNGKKKGEIARVLNDRTIPSPEEYAYQKFGRKKKNKGRHSIWTEGIVSRILSDERYTGVMILHRFEAAGVRGCLKRVPKEKWIRLDHNHEPILSKELFFKAQKKEKQKRQEKKHVKSIYICGCCGHVLMERKREGNFVCRYGTYEAKSRCLDVEISIHTVNMAVETMIRHLMTQNKDEATAIMDEKIKQLNYQYEEAEKKIGEHKDKKYRNYEAYAEKKRTKEDYIFFKNKYDDAIEGFQKQQRVIRKTVENAKNVFETLPVQKSIWIKQIKIYGNTRIEILLKCKKPKKI